MVEAVGLGRERAVVLIKAPAGYGKTTVASQWSRSDARPSAWLSLYEADNDATTLLIQLTRALGTLNAIDPELLAILEAPSPGIETVVLSRLLEDLGRSAPIQLVLDDVHIIDSPRALRVLKALVNAIPAGSQAVLVSRSVPPLGLARLRAAGDLHEIGPSDLAMDDAEGEELLATAGVHLDPDAVAELMAATEGWPTGLALVALAHRAGPEADPAALSSRSRSDIADYFREEVLDVQPEDIRQFLLSTSLVDQVCGPLGDAMTSRTDSTAVLRELAATNLFVIPVDDQGEWFRYHHLFQDLLIGELARRGEDAASELFDRAAAWYDGHGHPSEAFECARRARDLDRAGRVLLRHWDDYIGTGRIETLQRWLARCEEADIESDPQLALAAGWVTGHSGDAERANRYLAAAQRAPLDRPSPDGATSLHATMLNLRGSLGTAGVQQMLEDGLSLVESERAARTRWLIGGLRIVGFAHLLLGRPSEALGPLNEVVELSEGLDRARLPRVFCLGLLALCHGDLGDWTTARAVIGEAERHLTGVEHTVERLPVVVARAAISLQDGDGQAATVAVAHARELMPTSLATPGIRAELALRAATAAHRLGKGAVARELIGVSELACQRLGEAGSIPARIEALQERIAGVGSRVGQLTPAEQRIVRQLATHRTLKEIGEHLYISRSTVKTHVASIYSKLGVTTRDGAVAAMGDRITGAAGTTPDAELESGLKLAR